MAARAKSLWTAGKSIHYDSRGPTGYGMSKVEPRTTARATSPLKSAPDPEQAAEGK